MSALAQWAVFAKRKFVALTLDRVVVLYDDDDDAAKRALAATMARVLSRFVQRSLKQLEAHRALLALCFVATHDTDAHAGAPVVPQEVICLSTTLRKLVCAGGAAWACVGRKVDGQRGRLCD